MQPARTAAHRPDNLRATVPLAHARARVIRGVEGTPPPSVAMRARGLGRARVRLVSDSRGQAEPSAGLLSLGGVEQA
jgi:hypothetical protein